MEKFFAYQKDSRVPCKYGRKCFHKTKAHTDRYKHPPTRDDVKVIDKKKTRKRDSKGKLKLNNTTNGESSNVNRRELNDMEVPEQSNNTVNNETNDNTSLRTHSLSNQPNPTEYVTPSTRRSQQQQQLLLTNTALEDCSGDDGIVPCTPTLYTPRRLDGETVSSPHVPSSSQVERFVFVNDFQLARITGRNYEVIEEEPGPSEQIITPEIVTDPNSWNSKISKLFLVGEMPKEFYDFWSFCEKQCPAHPEDALLSVGLKLVGPYDVLAGHMNEFDANDIEKTVLHWRYYYDPPEFQTIIASTGSEFHIGYFRDQPLEMPVYVVSNNADTNCIIQKMGKSLFHAIRKYLQTIKSEDANVIQKKMLNYEKRKVTQILDGRQFSPITKTFHKAGIVVPYDSKTDVGYRPLSESENTLRKILKCYREASESKKIEAMDNLQPIINYANIACDECDFGTGLELGIDIFCDGNPELHRICKQLLVTAYNLLRRPEFATIIKAHLNNRRSGPNMSIL